MMNIFRLLSATLPALFLASSLCANAQTVRVDAYSDTSGIGDFNVPASLEQLVSSGSVVVKGRFSGLLSHGPFWGYGETRESMLQRVGSRPGLVERLAVPLSQYEIVIDEVLKGEVDVSSIVLHRIETVPDERMTDPSVERLFFLVMNPDEASYNARYILSKRDDNYVYEVLAPMVPGLPAIVRSVSLPFAGTMDATALEDSIRSLVAQ